MLTMPLLPASKFFLMAGSFSDVRLRGWVRAAQGEPAPEVLWEVYCDSLTDEAAAHGFVPYWSSKVEPTGVGFTEWASRFLSTFGY